MLHTKYISSGTHGFREKDFFFFHFPIISLWEFRTLWSVASLGPRGLIGRIFVGDH